MPKANGNNKSNKSLTSRRKEEAIAKAWERAKADSLKFDKMGIESTSIPKESPKKAVNKPATATHAKKQKPAAQKPAEHKQKSNFEQKPKNTNKAASVKSDKVVKASAKTAGIEEFHPYKPNPAPKNKKAADKTKAIKPVQDIKPNKNLKEPKSDSTAVLPVMATKPKSANKTPNSKAVNSKVSQNAKKPKKKRSKKRIAAVIAACFCGILLCGVGAVALALNMGKSNLVEQGNIDVNENAVSYDNGQTVEYNGVTYKRKNDMTSILLLGHDGRDGKNLNGQTDLIMVLAIDTNSGKMDIISVPRDTMVDIQRNYNKSDEYADTVRMQIATAFAYGSDFEHSAENVCNTVSSLIYNIPMSYYYVLNVNGVAPLTDAVGGVEVQALMDVPPAGIKEGQTYNLTGKKAYYYVQYRNTGISNSAVGRLDRQKQFLNAYAKKAFDQAKGNVGVLVDVFNTVSEYSTTNIGIPEFTYLASTFLNHGIDDFEITTLEGERSYNSSTGYEEVELNRDSVYQTVLDVYYEPLEEAQKSEAEAEANKSIDHVSDTSF
ncbi:LCP family protein [Adlercreutzia sp. ZJ154]|uniref:LCP family protein n=1 Tax=Adlercreutzia sp. ZJ154 TaxID=2709790 RepID=UPI0013ECB078|nr:LCP family protein [Adlercreutzia sp. ZJ154]